MALLTRSLLRQDVVARLRASTDEPLASLAPTAIYDSRGNPTQPDEDVAINVFTPRQYNRSISNSTRKSRITCTLYIEIHGPLTRDATTDLATLDATAAALADSYADAIDLTLFEDLEWLKQFETIGDAVIESEPDAVASSPRYVVKMTIDVSWARQYEPKAAHYVEFDGVNLYVDKIEPDTGTPDGVTDAAAIIDVARRP